MILLLDEWWVKLLKFIKRPDTADVQADAGGSTGLVLWKQWLAKEHILHEGR